MAVDYRQSGQQWSGGAGATSVSAGLAAKNLGAKKANEFDPFAYDVEAEAAGAYGAKNAAIARQAEIAADDARKRGAEALATGAATQTAGVDMLQSGAQGYGRANATTDQALAGARQVDATAADLRGQAQGQQGFARTLQEQYAGGTGPSAAQAQLAAGTSAAMRSNLALARSSGNPAAAYQAGLQNAAQTQQAANQAAQLRAQEQQQLLGQTLAAQGQAAQTTQASGQMFGAGAETRLATGAQQGSLASQQVQAGNTLAGIGTTQQQLGAQQQGLQLQSLGLQQGASDADRNAAIMRAQAEQQAFEQGRGYAQGANVDQQQALAGMVGQERANEQAGFDKVGKAMGIAGQGVSMFSQMFGGLSDERSKQKIRKLEAENAVLKGGKSDFDPFAALESEGVGDYDTPAPSAAEAEDERQFLADYDDELTGDAKLFRDQRLRDRAGKQPTTMSPWVSSLMQERQQRGQPVTAQAPADVYAQEYQAARAQMAGGMPAASNVSYAPNSGPLKWMPAGYATSDERSKRDVEDLFDPLVPIEHEYKPEYGPPGRRASIIAQDLEKSRLGKSMVHRDPKTDMRVVDTPQLTLANTAEIKLLREKIAALEGGRR